jgi:hypothetical protein
MKYKGFYQEKGGKYIIKIVPSKIKKQGDKKSSKIKVNELSKVDQ